MRKEPGDETLPRDTSLPGSTKRKNLARTCAPGQTLHHPFVLSI